MTTQTYVATLQTIECYSCHMVFGITREFYQDRLDRRPESFWCPAGHRQHFIGDTDLAKAEQSLARERARTDQLRAERDHLAATVRAEKGAKTKLKKRIAAGICPCCKRSFVDLGRHMAGQHPEYAE